jgi:hypothetical protein
MKKNIWKIINVLRGLFFKESEEVLILQPKAFDLSSDKGQEILRRLKYFTNEPNLLFTKRLKLADYFNFKGIVFLDGSQKLSVLKLKKHEVFNLDYDSNYLDGWDYHYLLSKKNKDLCTNGIMNGLNKLSRLKNSLGTTYSKTYIFGTGPSLEQAINVNFTDGIRIVSNTIVMDATLWKHIDPHFIVAGDAIYHFGIGVFAKNFRRDLKARLEETDTYFVFPAQYYPFCLKEFAGFEDRMIPVPIGLRSSIHIDLTVDYSLPIHGNALLLLLIPLACTLSKNVNLWGFDGRSPDDKLFWKNSPKHFYSDNVEELKILHPLFFEKLVPKNAPESYVKMVHGDVLENGLKAAERDGFTFKMLHKSFTETLMRRYSD